ncbi:MULTISPECIES: LysR family transcriptional regulator [Pseudomonas]|uniref:LysR family transcriptional regulator n=1 Tax=Pseudomonas TaxID=286 RepID=UPI000F7AA3CA|nr:MULTISPECIES: LysR family transcriptional regulator [Pseudomonas]MBH3372499.1 LysR family transcriptional regulator [Pseudomonas juntendi]MBS6039090.1 LysR family transcriptional regulator [Pseudomonas sp.]RRV73190.1 LysR family transcriptional regulator [Pseudomonas sp. p99-361]CAH0647255.1 HTH-type transcriptional regulator TsaR [Pseudomonas sp. Nvir]
MKLHQLRALVAIHNAGSILEASKLLHITQPALSRSIKELEREVGFALLQRSPKGMALTEEGKRVIRHANLVVESIRRLQLEAASIQDATLGAVSIGVTSLTAMLDGVDESILAFRRKYPRVKLTITDLRPSQILQRLRDGSLDFAITSQQPLSRLSLDWEALGSIKGSVICHVSNQQQFSKSLRTLQYAHWISLDELADQASQFHQLFEANGLPVPQNTVECTSVMMALKLLQNTEALMTISQLAVDQSFRYGIGSDFVVMPVQELIPDYPINLVCIDRHSLTTPAQELYHSLRGRVLRQARAGASEVVVHA